MNESLGKIEINFSIRYPKLTYLGSFKIFTSLRLLFFPNVSKVLLEKKPYEMESSNDNSFL